MKKLTLMLGLVSMIFASSCSSDDDSGSQDKFIGTWKYYAYFEDDVEVVVEMCGYEETIVISANGTYTYTDYYEVDGNCELDESFSGTWVNEGSGFYSTTSGGETFTQEIHFEGNTMYFEEVDEGVVYRDVYIRQ